MPRRETLVFDSTPLIALFSAGFHPEGARLGVRILIAEEVREEVAGDGRGPRSPDQLLLRQWLDEGQIPLAVVRDHRKIRPMLENPRLSQAHPTPLCLDSMTHPAG